MIAYCFCPHCQAAAHRRQWNAIVLGLGIVVAGLAFILITT